MECTGVSLREVLSVYSLIRERINARPILHDIQTWYHGTDVPGLNVKGLCPPSVTKRKVPRSRIKNGIYLTSSLNLAGAIPFVYVVRSRDIPKNCQVVLDSEAEALRLKESYDPVDIVVITPRIKPFKKLYHPLN
jgi:hypothetical protein